MSTVTGNPVQENEIKGTADERYKATVKQWWGSKFPTLVLSLHTPCTAEQQANRIQTFPNSVERVCEVLCKNLPQHALLIAGEKDGVIDRFMYKYIANGQVLQSIVGPIGETSVKGISGKNNQHKKKNRKQPVSNIAIQNTGFENPSYQIGDEGENTGNPSQQPEEPDYSKYGVSETRSENNNSEANRIAGYDNSSYHTYEGEEYDGNPTQEEEPDYSDDGIPESRNENNASDRHDDFRKTGKSVRLTENIQRETFLVPSDPNVDKEICDISIKGAKKAPDSYDVTSSKRNENGISNKHVLSMYHCRKHYCLEYSWTEKTSAEKPSLEENRHDQKSKFTAFDMSSRASVCVVYMHLEVAKEGRPLKIRFTSDKKKALETIIDRVNRKKPKPYTNDDPSTDFEDEERLRKFLLTSIFRKFITAMHGDEDDQTLFDSFDKSWYNEEILRALLDNAARDKSTKFGFDTAIKEDWIEEFIKSEEKAESTTTYKVLFVMCVQNGLVLDQDVVFKFWNQGKNAIAMALMAYKVSKNMSLKYEGSEIGEKMETQMEDFQNLAIKLLKRCFSENEDLTFQLLLGRISDLQNMTLIDVALAADSQKFIAQKPCRKLMERLWIEPLKMNNRRFYTSLIASAICPFLSPLLMTFDESSTLFSDEILDVALTEDRDLRDKYSYSEFCCIKNRNMIENCTGNYSDEDEDEDEEETKRCLTRRCFASTCCILCFPIWISYIFGSHYVWLLRCFFIAPIIRFIYHAISHVSYLTLFSIVLLTDFKEKIGAKEIVLDVWTLILAIEEAKQVVTEREHYLDTWNVLDASGLLLFFVGFILRLIFHVSRSICPEGLYVARILFAFSLMIFFLRTLQMLSIERTLGPKIHMINRLLLDMVSFMLILAVFVSAYGVGSNIILYPNQPLDIYLLRDIFYDSWWSVLGQFDREDALGDSCTNPPPNITKEYCSSVTDPDIDYQKCKESRCPANHWIVPILMVVYAIITIVMMLNILIAMFNDVFSKVQEKREQVYNLQRYRLMREYYNRVGYPAPFCVITYWRIIPYLIQVCRGVEKLLKKKRVNVFSENLPDEATEMEIRYSNDRSETNANDDIEDAKILLTKLKKEDLDAVKDLMRSLSKR